MYSIFLNPFVKIIETIFLWNVNIFENLGFSLVILSLVISILLLPLYYIAEKIERKEKLIQKQMEPKINELKSVYKGYELHLYIKNVHRLNKYRPIYSIRSLLSLLIQIPFFLAAYSFLSSYVGFEGVSLLRIANLANPDSLIKIGKTTINLLPFLMTAFNLAAGYVYSKDSKDSEKITIILIAALFLIVLYNSPASLLIYWTFNNVFSLIKNIVFKHLSNKSNKTINNTKECA